MSRIVKDAYAYDVVTYMEQSIEIISPYISDLELKQLKSQYRQIDSRQKFQALNIRLIKLSHDNKVNLPNISLLKIEDVSNPSSS